MTPEEYRKLEEQFGPDDAKRLVTMQRICEAVRELAAFTAGGNGPRSYP